MPPPSGRIPSQTYLAVLNAGWVMYLLALLLVLGLLLRLPRQGANRPMIRFWLTALLLELLLKGSELHGALTLSGFVPPLEFSVPQAVAYDFVRQVMQWLFMSYLVLGALVAAEIPIRRWWHGRLFLGSIALAMLSLLTSLRSLASIESVGVGLVLLASALLVSREARGERERGMLFLAIAMVLYAIPHLVPSLSLLLGGSITPRARQIKNMIEPFALTVTVLLLGGATILLVLQDSVLRVGRLREEHIREVGASEARLQAIIGAAGEAILTFTPAWVVELANEASARLFRAPSGELVGRRLVELIDLDEGRWSSVFDDVSSGRRPQVTVTGTGNRPDDAAFPVECTLAALAMGDPGRGGGVAILRDLSKRLAAEAERERFERRIAESEKMLAIGRVVSGVAHELNNPLAVVLGQSEQLVDDGTDQELRTGMRLINEQAHRARHIVRDLLAFVREGQDHREPVNLGRLVERVVAGQAAEAGSLGIALRHEVTEGEVVVMADPVAVEQVLVNLIDNAFDATGAAGLVRVRLGCRTGAAELMVEDNGPGVPDGIENRIFEPFFTTKPTGAGTGLGLSVSVGLLERLGGSLLFENRPTPTVGARFVVRLPLAPVDATPPTVAPDGPQPAPTLPSGSPGTVLIVDDEPSVRITLERIFRRWGWEVITRGDGATALSSLAPGTRPKPDLILCDLRMPQMTGEAFYAALESVRPELLERVVFVTGDMVAQDTARFLAVAGRPVVEKPFTIPEISRIVTEVVGSA